MSRPVRLIACLWLALPAIFIAAIAQADVKSPLQVELNLPQLPEVGQEVVLDCTLESRFAMKGVSLTIQLPDGVDLVKGSTTWQGDMSVLQIMPLQLTIKAISAGNKTIRATAFCRIDEKTAYSDVSQVFFHSQEGFAVVGHVTDTVPTQGTCACLETGEVSNPMKLADYMKLPVQAPITPEPCRVGPGESEVEDEGPAPEGTLVVSGRWCYFDRDDVYTPMQWVYVQLRHGLTDAVLAYTYVTNNNGQYTFPPVTNPGVFGFRVRVFCFHLNTASCDGKALRVVGVGAGRDDGGNVATPCYAMVTETRTSDDGTYDMGTWHVANGDATEPAWWVVMDLNQGFWWPYAWNNHTTMNGGVTVEWSSTSTHGNHNHSTDDGGNIHLVADAPDFCDVVLHEYGHEVQWDGYGQWLPEPDCPEEHYFQEAGGPHCGWYEGFANWYKFAVTEDPVFHWSGGGVLNIENPTWGTPGWDNGDQVEGRVAGAMWDIGDSNADGYDTCDHDWEDIWDTWYGHPDNTFGEFWNRWRAYGNLTHHPIKALYQNTIDYNHSPTFSGLPDISTPEDTPVNNAFTLWNYAYDQDSNDWDLDYSIVFASAPECGVSIDQFDTVDVNPDPNWYGTCTVSVLCTDGIVNVYDGFTVTVTPVNDPPVISGVPNKSLDEDTSLNNAIDLWAYADDVETPNSQLLFTLPLVTQPECGVTIDSNRYIDINPNPNWSGYCQVTVRVRDPEGLWHDDTFSIMVKMVNDPPVMSPLPDRMTNEDTPWNNAIDLWALTDDVDNADEYLTFTIEQNTNANCGVSIDSNRYVDINPAPNWFGTSDVTIRATDPGGLSDDDRFTITVIAVNDTPVISLPDQLLAKDTSRDNAFHIWAYAGDVETPDENLTYAMTANTDPQCGVSMDANYYIDINPAPGYTGYSDVTVRVTDPEGLWAEDTFRTVVAIPFDKISQARANENSTWVSLTDKITTGQFVGFYYVEEPDRSSGIRIDASAAYDPGSEVTVAGPLTISDSERRITAYYQQLTGGRFPLGPLGMPNGVLGGAAPDAYTPAVPNGGAGAYNVGLLVRTTGEVMKWKDGSCLISDGSSIVDNLSGQPSLYVEAVPSGYWPPIGSHVSVTGISGASTYLGNAMRVLRPRDDSDIVVTRVEVAYIYDTNPTDASSFKNWLDNQSLPTTLIRRSQLTSANLRQYGVVLIGHDTGNWSNQAHVDAVVNADKPIVAIGTGGAYFLDRVDLFPDLYLGKSNSTLVSNQRNAVPVGGDIYSYPYRIDVLPLLNLFQAPGTSAECLNDSGGHGVTHMLRQEGMTTRYPLASEGGRFYQWGFSGAPNVMTTTGRQLFLNLLFSTAR